MSSNSGVKRPREDDAARSGREEAPSSSKKPRDWRDAFLDDGDGSSSRDTSRSRTGGRDRERDGRDGYGRDTRDRSWSKDRNRVDVDKSRKSQGGSSGGGSGGGRAYYDDRRDSRNNQNSSYRNDRDRYESGSNRGGNGGRGGYGQDRSFNRGQNGNPADYDRRVQPGGGFGQKSPPRERILSVDGLDYGGAEEGEIIQTAPANRHPGFQPAASAHHSRSTSIQPSEVPANISKPSATPEPQSKAAEPEVIPDLPLVQNDPETIEKELEERRRRRRELMEKFAGIQSGAASTAASSIGGMQSVQSNGKTDSPSSQRILAATGSLNLTSSANTPTGGPPPSDIFDLSKHDEKNGKDEVEAKDVLPPVTQSVEVDGEAQISAADYDPNEDRKADEARFQKHNQQQNPSTLVKQEEVASGVGEPGPSMLVDSEDEYEEVEVDDDEDEEFDMFAVDEPKKKKIIRRKKQTTTTAVPAPIKALPVIPALVNATLVDNFDDHEGYYRITPGEILDNGRYQVSTNLGKGMFSAVIKAIVLKVVDAGDVVGKEVAIKVIRSQESMYAAGRKEVQILSKLAAADPEDKKHIVRLFRTFEHRGHLCIVTESLSMNLRDVVKRFGKDVGLNMKAVRAYAHQIFLALSLMKKCNIIHADIKPDNILVSENKAVLKVCDLGSACEASESEITPYLVSRFYRAPEIILGLPYNEALDIWSVGCTLFELYTGKILFPGRSNNHMLHVMMDLKGKFNHKMIKKSQFGEMHFDEGMNFRSVEKDKITGQDVTKTLIINKASRDLKARLMPSFSIQMKMKDDELKMLTSFVDLLDKCLALDPAKRITSREALLHPFLNSS